MALATLTARVDEKDKASFDTLISPSYPSSNSSFYLYQLVKKRTSYCILRHFYTEVVCNRSSDHSESLSLF